MAVAGFLPQQETVQRADGAALSPQEFSEHFELGYQPVMLSGLQEGWLAGSLSLLRGPLSYNRDMHTRERPKLIWLGRCG